MLVEFKNIGRNHVYETMELRGMRAVYARLNIYLMDEPFDLVKVKNNTYRVAQGCNMLGSVTIHDEKTKNR